MIAVVIISKDWFLLPCWGVICDVNWLKQKRVFFFFWSVVVLGRLDVDGYLTVSMSASPSHACVYQPVGKTG